MSGHELLELITEQIEGLKRSSCALLVCIDGVDIRQNNTLCFCT
jgi:hypothetical protein